MGTAHGAEELGLCPHGLAYQAGVWGRYIGFCPRYGHIWKIQTSICWQNYSSRLVILFYDEILTIEFCVLIVGHYRFGLRYRASKSRNERATIGINLRTQFLASHL